MDYSEEQAEGRSSGEIELRLERKAARDWRCVYCHEGIAVAPLVCPVCRAMTHRDCSREFGRCPTPGCEGDALNPPIVEAEKVSRLSSKAVWGAFVLGLALGLGLGLWLFRS
jgi:hypothetical protein